MHDMVEGTIIPVCQIQCRASKEMHGVSLHSGDYQARIATNSEDCARGVRAMTSGTTLQEDVKKRSPGTVGKGRRPYRRHTHGDRVVESHDVMREPSDLVTVRKARDLETEYVKQMGVYGKVPMEQGRVRVDTMRLGLDGWMSGRPTDHIDRASWQTISRSMRRRKCSLLRRLLSR